jgi:hypothetical protein
MAASVARKVEPSMRIEGLTWWHHLAVAKLSTSERTSWLERAMADRLSVQGLRIALRNAGHLPNHQATSRQRRLVRELVKLKGEEFEHDMLTKLRNWWDREIGPRT